MKSLTILRAGNSGNSRDERHYRVGYGSVLPRTQHQGPEQGPALVLTVPLDGPVCFANSFKSFAENSLLSASWIAILGCLAIAFLLRLGFPTMLESNADGLFKLFSQLRRGLQEIRMSMRGPLKNAKGWPGQRRWREPRGGRPGCPPTSSSMPSYHHYCKYLPYDPITWYGNGGFIRCSTQSSSTDVSS